MAGTIMAGQTSNYNFDYPTSTDYVKDGATAIQELADDVDATLFTALGGAYPGLRLVKKQTIGAGVSSVTVTSAFSTTYQNYRIVVSDVDATNGGSNINITYNNAAGNTYFWAGNYLIYNGTNTFFGNNNVASSSVALAGTNTTTAFVMDVYSPFLAKRTTYTSQYSGSAYGGNLNGLENTAISHTGFTLTVAAGTLTGGTIYVYGYGAS
jgi:hypothetical protein